MSDTPKFTVVDRRKFRADDDSAPAVETSVPTAPVGESADKTASAPRLTLVEPMQPAATVAELPVNPEDDTIDEGLGAELDGAGMPPAPTFEESSFQKAAYERAAERLDDLIRAQNPGGPPVEKIGFEHLVQQLYLSAMMQMGAGTPEGQRPRVDILGARQTIDLLGVVQEKTRGKLTKMETRALDTVLYELHANFQELTRMVTTQPVPPVPPVGAKR